MGCVCRQARGSLGKRETRGGREGGKGEREGSRPDLVHGPLEGLLQVYLGFKLYFSISYDLLFGVC